MMTEKYPAWLEGHVKEWAEKRLPTVTLCSTSGNELPERGCCVDYEDEKEDLEPDEVDTSGNELPERGCCVDYEDEKEDLEPDEVDTMEQINSQRMPWGQVKRNGIRCIALYYVNEDVKQVQILDAELA